MKCIGSDVPKYATGKIYRVLVKYQRKIKIFGDFLMKRAF